ncbi:MAG TPA: hypothetical protein VN960_10465, partial [Gaiellaceae bacterium]|nr:hypothetical protein [Gaiellaceae bacterium]
LVFLDVVTLATLAHRYVGGGSLPRLPYPLLEIRVPPRISGPALAPAINAVEVETGAAVEHAAAVSLAAPVAIAEPTGNATGAKGYGESRGLTASGAFGEGEPEV